MAIEHKDIPDGQRHEPKGIGAAATRSVYKANGGGSGSWVKLTDLDMDYSVKANNVFGWNDIADNQYTSGAPRAIASDTRTQLTNNGLGTQTDVTRLGSLWASNAFLINDLNAFYQLRIAFKVTAAAAAGTPYILTTELQSDNASTVIAADSKIIKGGGVVNSTSLNIPFYMGSFVNNQNLKLFVTADTAINIYDIGFVLHRTYVEV